MQNYLHSTYIYPNASELFTGWIKQANIKLVEMPSQSPDPNPTENMDYA